MISNREIIIRLLISALLGGLIGAEREVNNRPAGLRTHILVTIGAALVMLISIDGFINLVSSDPSRLAAQVVSGIGFLGAGTIMRTGNHITGLTTAASLWVCACIGLGIGAGYYMATIAASVIVLITLMSAGTLEKKVLKKNYSSIEVVSINKPGIIGNIGTLFGKYYLSIKDIIISEDSNNYEENGIMEIRFLVKIPTNFNSRELYNELYQTHGIISVRFEGKIISNNNI